MLIQAIILCKLINTSEPFVHCTTLHVTLFLIQVVSNGKSHVTRVVNLINKNCTTILLLFLKMCPSEIIVKQLLHEAHNPLNKV